MVTGTFIRSIIWPVTNHRCTAIRDPPQRFRRLVQLLAWAILGDGAPEPASVSADATARAGDYIDYAAAMLDRVTGGLAIGRAQADAASIARHILARPPATRAAPLNERELYQTPGYTWARDTERRAAALHVLDHAGWIRHPIGAGGGRPRGDWEVSLRLWE